MAVRLFFYVFCMLLINYFVSDHFSFIAVGIHRCFAVFVLFPCLDRPTKWKRTGQLVTR